METAVPLLLCAGKKLVGASNKAEGKCDDCGAGKFQDAKKGHRETSCKGQTTCAKGEILDGATKQKDGTCKTCDNKKGQYQEAGPAHREATCKTQPECEPGTLIKGNTNQALGKCEKCAAGTFQDTSKHRIGVCKAQKECAEGKYLKGASSKQDGACTDCGASSGTYMDIKNNRVPRFTCTHTHTHIHTPLHVWVHVCGGEWG